MASTWHSVWAAVLLAICVGVGQRTEAAEPVTIWAAPAQEKMSEDYALQVNGKNVPVYACRVSAVPFNQVWPGYQRPVDQTELAAFAHWGMSGPVTVEITSKRTFTNVVVRPVSRGVRPAVQRPAHHVCALEGRAGDRRTGRSASRAAPVRRPAGEPTCQSRDAAGVRYFGPGVHRPGKIQLKSGETLYVAGGAVVYTAVEARGAAGRADSGPRHH